MYLILKNVHLTLVSISVAGFMLRAIWVRCTQLDQTSFRKPKGWLSRLAHAIDSLLLVSGLGLMALTHFTPFNTSWLAIKLLLLLGYIFLGALGLHYAPPQWRTFCCILALTCVTSMALLAIEKPTLW
ncbi:SirB2 family protein [Aestuariicella sp. G3-2]|uniref:SirB2 family protein n=1 Tax=Pseudomaricurvus albidus TaxID=2842452 RepID=UPI001C0E1283|nr:SirB2 family protein [Aestuariicella albida]